MNLVSREEALIAGAGRYFPGTPCKQQHIAERYVSSGSCCECLRMRKAKYRSKTKSKEDTKEYNKRYYEKNKGAISLFKRELREKDPEKYRAACKAYRERNPDRYRSSLVALRYARRLSEAGRPKPTQCEICSESSKIVFDHCHTSGSFRGWICDRCNRTLGFVRDSTELLSKLASYLEKAKALRAAA